PSSSTPSLVVAPVAAPALASDPVAPDDGVPRFEMAIDYWQVCIRIEGRLHCADGPADGRSLASTPPLLGIDDAISLSLGGSFGCIVRRRGTVSCWGANDGGQLGAGLREERSDVAVEVTGITNARRVLCAARHACALLA